MKVTISQIGHDAHFVGTTPNGQQLEIHSPLAATSEKVAPSPMEALLMAAASCSSVDVLLILEKMKQNIEHLSVEVEGVREEIESAKPFRAINFVFFLKGDLDQKKAERAVGLSVEKYCSVLESLHPVIEISWTVQLL